MMIANLRGLMVLVRRDGRTEHRDDLARQFVATDPTGTTTETLPYDDRELAAADARALLSAQAVNASTLQARATAALKTNRNFLALTAPTTAQAVAQVKALTRQNVALFRLVAELLDGTE